MTQWWLLWCCCLFQSEVEAAHQERDTRAVQAERLREEVDLLRKQVGGCGWLGWRVRTSWGHVGKTVGCWLMVAQEAWRRQ